MLLIHWYAAQQDDSPSCCSSRCLVACVFLIRASRLSVQPLYQNDDDNTICYYFTFDEYLFFPLNNDDNFYLLFWNNSFKFNISKRNLFRFQCGITVRQLERNNISIAVGKYSISAIGYSGFWQNGTEAYFQLEPQVFFSVSNGTYTQKANYTNFPLLNGQTWPPNFSPQQQVSLFNGKFSLLFLFTYNQDVILTASVES
jgi:hypothetical protein